MEVLDAIIQPWRSGIDRRAMLELVMLGGVCGGLSFWVISFRLSYPAESLGHGLLPGLVIAALAGLPLLLGAGAGVAVAALAIWLAGRDERIGADTATAVAVTGLFGLGALLALTPEAPVRLEELLFGDPLGVSDSDLGAAAALALLGGAALFALHRPLCAMAFDPLGAGGPAPARVRLALMALMAASVAVAVRGLGSLLVLAILVAPAVAVHRHVRGPGTAVLAGAAVAALAGIAGIYASHHLSSAAGASVALVLCAVAAAGAALVHLRPGARPRRGRAGA